MNAIAKTILVFYFLLVSTNWKNPVYTGQRTDSSMETVKFDIHGPNGSKIGTAEHELKIGRFCYVINDHQSGRRKIAIGFDGNEYWVGLFSSYVTKGKPKLSLLIRAPSKSAFSGYSFPDSIIREFNIAGEHNMRLFSKYAFFSNLFHLANVNSDKITKESFFKNNSKVAKLLDLDLDLSETMLPKSFFSKTNSYASVKVEGHLWSYIVEFDMDNQFCINRLVVNADRPGFMSGPKPLPTGELPIQIVLNRRGIEATLAGSFASSRFIQKETKTVTLGLPVESKGKQSGIRAVLNNTKVSGTENAADAVKNEFKSP